MRTRPLTILEAVIDPAGSGSSRSPAFFAQDATKH